MVQIPGGTFQMGSNNTSLESLIGNGEPVHSVTVSSFYMDTTLVTQASYQALMGVNPSYFDTGALAPRKPVESVTWFDAVLYCNARSKQDGYDTIYSYTTITGTPGNGCTDLGSLAMDFTKHGYRLPTEAEWEYACRAGSTADYYWGQCYPPQTTADTAEISAHAWWCYNSPNGTQPVAIKPANAWGLHDMSGNVWEWCNDWYGNYSSGSQTDPTGPTAGSYRVLRGGSWYDGGDVLCAAYRGSYLPGGWNLYLGFRCVRR
jgi:formylglycine-generating enzyme required for sulfatase activity